MQCLFLYFCNILSYRCQNDVFEDSFQSERNYTTCICAKISHLWLIPSQFPNLVDPTKCRMSFLGIFPRYRELPMSERRVWGFIENIIGNYRTRISTKISYFWLIPSQFPNLMDLTNCRMSFFSVFLRFLELPMSKRRVWGFVENLRGNYMTCISAKILHFWLIPSQFPNLVDPTDC